MQRETGVAVNVHTPRHPATERDRPPSWWGLKILDILEDAGADLNRVIIGHLDRCTHEDLDFQREIAKRGAYISTAFGERSSISRPTRRATSLTRSGSSGSET